MPSPQAGPLYKIIPDAAWAASDGEIPWAEVDRADGFVHFSAAHQVRETAAKHFAGQVGLRLLEVDPARLPPEALKWDISRGGDRFPHVYGPVSREAVVGDDPLPWVESEHRFPFQVPCPIDVDALPAERAQRLEQAEVGVMVGFSRAAHRLSPPLPLGFKQLGSAVATRFESGSSPLNTVKGWGLTGEVSIDELQAFEAMFGDASFAIEQSSHADRSALVLLGAAGYQPVEIENVLFRPLIDIPSFDEQYRIQPIASHEGRAWGEMLAAGFVAQGEPPPELITYGRVTQYTGQTTAYWIMCDAEPVGVCSLRLDHDIALMMGTSVLPQARGRGAHRAAIGLRLQVARDAGCRIAKLDVLPGSASHRNAHRMGFGVSHTRMGFVRGSKRS